MSIEAAMRHFLTLDLDAETMAGLHIGLRKMGWMDQSSSGGPMVAATTASLIVGNKLRGKMLARRRKKQKDKAAKEAAAALAAGGTATTTTTTNTTSDLLQAGGNSRYHDEGIMHLPHEGGRGRSGASRGAGKSHVLSRLKMAQHMNVLKKKSSFASMVQTNRKKVPPPSTASTMATPFATHLNYHPLGFASFDDGKSNKDERDREDEDEDSQKLKSKTAPAAETMLESVTKDEHSFTQACANRNVITFNSRMSAGADRVMSIEADEATSVASDLLHQVRTNSGLHISMHSTRLFDLWFGKD